jgi:HK97 family phage major capsid protein/HK97 family phage prohead protease
MRACALLDIKAVDDARRELTGIATTPTPDRGGDIVEPLGAQFRLPLPLLWQHDQKQPIGEVYAAEVSPRGITIQARLAQVDEPGALRDRLDEAWQSLKATPPLVRGLSIGYKPIAATPRPGTRGGLHIKEWQWAEVSAVTIPQNVEATILAVKSAAFGLHSPGAAGTLPVVSATKDAHMAQTIPEQITAFENTRAAKAARLTELMQKAADEHVTLDAAQTEEYDTAAREIESIDAHLVRLRALEQTQVKAATPITAVTNPQTASAARSGGTVPVIQVKSHVEPGTGFVRFAQALMATKGNHLAAVEFAKRWHDSTPEVELALKAAVAAGTTTDAVWAGPLAPIKPLANEFLALLRPATILGKIDGFRQVPFNVSVPSQTAGGSYKWVGQGAPKPVGSLAFATITLGITKCAGIIVITDELARNSTPSAEAVIRADMIAGIAQFLDVQLTDPANAPVAGVNPGSLTNGVTPITSAGTTPANARTDLQALINAMVTANISVEGAYVIMSQTNAAALGAALNPLGQPLFPQLNVTGGTAMGLKVVASQSAGNNVILVQPQTVLYADDGGVTIDASMEASIQMDGAPMNPPDATVVLTSLWQNNLVGLRAERYINWKRARTGGVQYTVQGYIA